jgi:predicted DNA-binding protein
MMSAPEPTTGSVTVRLPIQLLRKLDELCTLTERTRTYWVTKALEEVVHYELEDARAIADDRDSEGDIPNERLDEYMIANGLTTREALDRAAAASGRRRA